MAKIKSETNDKNFKKIIENLEHEGDELKKNFEIDSKADFKSVISNSNFEKYENQIID